VDVVGVHLDDYGSDIAGPIAQNDWIRRHRLCGPPAHSASVPPGEILTGATGMGWFRAVGHPTAFDLHGHPSGPLNRVTFDWVG